MIQNLGPMMRSVAPIRPSGNRAVASAEASYFQEFSQKMLVEAASIKRRGWDLNPRSPGKGSAVFKTAPFDRSGTPPCLDSRNSSRSAAEAGFARLAAPGKPPPCLQLPRRAH